MTPMIADSPADRLSPLEKQFRLNSLTDDYFRGSLTLEEFIDEREALDISYNGLIEELARHQPRPVLSSDNGYQYLRDMLNADRQRRSRTWFERLITVLAGR